MGLPVSYSELLRMQYRDRLPHKLDDLTGPAHGSVQLPLHIAWSGMTAFDLDRPKHWESAFPELNDGQPDVSP
jgi:hypothetical protein